jgi:hypothetical protein
VVQALVKFRRRGHHQRQHETRECKTSHG